MVRLVALLQAAQDRDRALERRLADVDRLEAPLERRVLLDVLLVLVERGRADRAQLAARQHRLQQVGRVDRTLGRAGADDRVQLVHEQDDLALGVRDLLQDGLQPLLELAAVLAAREQRADVEADHLAVAEGLGDVAGDDPLREALDDGGLAHAGLADQDRVVLRAAGEDLDHAADLVVAPDDRVELAVLGGLREVAPELLQRLVLLLGALVGHAMRPADGLDALLERLVRRAVAVEALRGLAALRVGEREQDVLGRDVLVVELAGLALGEAQDVHELAARRRLLRARGDRRQLVQRLVDLRPDRLRTRAELAQNRPDNTLGLLEQSHEQVLGLSFRVMAGGRHGDRGLQRLLGLDRETVGLHSVLNLSR